MHCDLAPRALKHVLDGKQEIIRSLDSIAAAVGEGVVPEAAEVAGPSPAIRSDVGGAHAVIAPLQETDQIQTLHQLTYHAICAELDRAFS